MSIETSVVQYAEVRIIACPGLLINGVNGGVDLRFSGTNGMREMRRLITELTNLERKVNA